MSESVTGYAGALLVHDREIHLYADADLVVGDVVELIRGNGPQEGGYMGSATVNGFEEDGAPIFIWPETPEA